MYLTAVSFNEFGRLVRQVSVIR